jgi:hypothetical protein
LDSKPIPEVRLAPDFWPCESENFSSQRSTFREIGEREIPGGLRLRLMRPVTVSRIRLSEACRREVVTYRLFRMHVQRSPKYARRLKQAEEVREHFLREFHIANITQHSHKNVAASMFWLERRYPNEFALRTVIS